MDYKKLVKDAVRRLESSLTAIRSTLSEGSILIKTNGDRIGPLLSLLKLEKEYSGICHDVCTGLKMRYLRDKYSTKLGALDRVVKFNTFSRDASRNVAINLPENLDLKVIKSSVSTFGTNKTLSFPITFDMAHYLREHEVMGVVVSGIPEIKDRKFDYKVSGDIFKREELNRGKIILHIPRDLEEILWQSQDIKERSGELPIEVILCRFKESDVSRKEVSIPDYTDMDLLLKTAKWLSGGTTFRKTPTKNIGYRDPKFVPAKRKKSKVNKTRQPHRPTGKSEIDRPAVDVVGSSQDHNSKLFEGVPRYKLKGTCDFSELEVDYRDKVLSLLSEIETSKQTFGGIGGPTFEVEDGKLSALWDLLNSKNIPLDNFYAKTNPLADVRRVVNSSVGFNYKIYEMVTLKLSSVEPYCNSFKATIPKQHGLDIAIGSVLAVTIQNPFDFPKDMEFDGVEVNVLKNDNDSKLTLEVIVGRDVDIGKLHDIKDVVTSADINLDVDILVATETFNELGSAVNGDITKVYMGTS